MNQNQHLQLFDPARWLFGQLPPWFLMEVAGRAVVIYLALQIILRLMGRRMAAQMTTAELAVIVTLGAAIGVPMQVPNQGMLAAILILLIALVFQRGLALLNFYSHRTEVASTGDVVILVEDGRILMDVLKALALSRDRLFAALRGEGIEQLGEVRRVYVEATGNFSVFRSRQPVPGLSVLPTFDEAFRGNAEIRKGEYVCFSCGGKRAVTEMPREACPHCGGAQWTEAVCSSKMREDHES